MKENLKIKQNQVIALVGQTGMATGSHLHFSIRFNGELIDPIYFINLPFTDEVRKEYVARGDRLI